LQFCIEISFAEAVTSVIKTSLSNANKAQILEIAESCGLLSIDDLIHFPKHVEIETVATCNARCIMCPVEEWERAALLMPDDLFNKIVADVTPFMDWIERITIQLDGEPLIDKKLERRIGQLKDLGAKFVTFTCNGSLMSEERARSVLESGVDEITFSFDGSSKDIFEKIRVRLNFDEVLHNITQFVKIRDEIEARCVVRIRMTVQPSNYQEYESFLALWEPILGPRDRAYGRLMHNWGNGSFPEGFRLPAWRDRDDLNQSACHAPWSSIVIMTDGRVPVCCSDYNAGALMGNVYDKSIQDIWKDVAFEKFRAAHLSEGRNGVKMCIDCNTWDNQVKIKEDLDQKTYAA
jgi:radical SAM protein with 4Fe4S-binding SPASM domain